VTTPYVHVEVTEVRSTGYEGIEADVRVYHPDGHPFSLLVRAGGRQQPFWPVRSVETLGSPEILDAVFSRIGQEALYYRISVALSLWNIWDSAKASSDRFREMDQDRDDI
jgi:hypothetical protein